MQRQRMKNLLLRARDVDSTSKIKISRGRLTEYVEIFTIKRAARAARQFFLVQPIKALICGVVIAVAVVIS